MPCGVCSSKEYFMHALGYVLQGVALTSTQQDGPAWCIHSSLQVKLTSCKLLSLLVLWSRTPVVGLLQLSGDLLSCRSRLPLVVKMKGTLAEALPTTHCHCSHREVWNTSTRRVACETVRVTAEAVHGTCAAPFR